MTDKSFSHRPDIDGLRALAVTPVILFHYKIGPAEGGFLGVDVFFVISGYLITAQLLAVAEDLSFRKFISGFYARRIRRILPAVLTVLALCLLFGYFVLAPADLANLANSSAFSAVGIANFFFYANTGYFDRKAELQPLLHMWSLGVEEQFYFIWPFLIFLLVRLLRTPMRVCSCLVVLTLAGLAYAELAIVEAPKAAFFLPLPRAWELSSGALLAFLPAIRSRTLSEVIDWAGFVLLAASFSLYSASEHALGLNMVPVILGAACLVAARQADSVSHILSLKPLRWIGLLSFSLYLWHWPVLVFFRLLNLEAYPQGSETALLIAVTLGLAFLSYTLIETPIRKQEFRFAAKLTTPAFILVIACSLAVVKGDGLEYRLPPAAKTLAASAADYSSRRPECHRTDAFNPPLDESCRFGAQDSIPKVAMWSDSHGVELVHALGDLLQDKGISFLGLTYSSCPPAQNFRSVFQNGYQDFARKTLDYLVHDADIKTVIFAGYYELYQQGGSWSELKAGLEESLKVLAGNGKHVVLIASNPEMGFSLPQAGVRQAMLSSNPQLEVTLEQHRAFSAQTTEFLNYLRTKYPNVSIFDPADVLCNGKVCHMIRDGQTILFDADHLTLTAARPVAAELIRQLPELGQ